MAQQKYTTKCIYFPDKEQVEKMEALLKRFPKTTLSAILAQLLPTVVKQLEQLPDGKRQLHINTRIWV